MEKKMAKASNCCFYLFATRKYYCISTIAIPTMTTMTAKKPKESKALMLAKIFNRAKEIVILLFGICQLLALSRHVSHHRFSIVPSSFLSAVFTGKVFIAAKFHTDNRMGLADMKSNSP